MGELIFYAFLALVCAFASGWLLCQWWHGWGIEADAANRFADVEKLRETNASYESWQRGRIEQRRPNGR